MTWEEVCADPALASLPYRIETDKWGNILMSPPPGGYHSYRETQIAFQLQQMLTGGYGLAECPVQTAGGVKAMDAKERFEQLSSKESSVHQIAPEICVEVRSPRNTFAETQEKMQLYFGAGAIECWVCDREGQLSFFEAEGPIARSKLCPDFPAQVR